MGSVRQKRSAKSGAARNTRRTKQKDRSAKIKGNPIIEQNWDHNLTLAQNYKRLGLRSSLGMPSGGREKSFKELTTVEEPKKEKPRKLSKNEGRIVRDDDGNVIRVEYAKEVDSEDEQEEEWLGFEEDKTDVIRQLEEFASHEVKSPHFQSDSEKGWVERLIEKHGDDYEAMFRDRKLNVMQQSVGELRRRVYKYKKANNLL